MGLYILDVILFQSCFLGLYLVFKKETFYSYNRLYLLGTALLSFMLPMLDLGFLAFDLGSANAAEQTTSQFQNYFLIGKEVNLTASGQTSTPQTSSWTLDAFLKLVYLMGFSVFCVKFSIGYWKLKQLTGAATFESYKDNIKCYSLSSSSNAFTFWNSIFIGDQIAEDQRNKIIVHELEHAKANHGVDLFFSEILRALLWLSPAHHVLKRELLLVHELQADAVAAKHISKKDYAQSLLNQAFGTQNFEFSNSFFNHSQLKLRLMMLQKKNSTVRSKLKYLLILPLVALMLTYTACKEESKDEIQQMTEEAEAEQLKAQYMKELKEAVAKYGMYSDDMPSKFKFKKDNEINSKEDFYRRNVYMIFMAEKMEEKSTERTKITYSDNAIFQKFKTQTYDEFLEEIKNKDEIIEAIEEEAIGDVPFAVIENVPVFPGCEGLENNEERKECMGQKISEIVSENFNTDLAEELDLKGINRVYVQFKIDKTGKIVDVSARAPHPRLETEAERVIDKLPTMKPGEQKGEKVGVLYSLPITFKVGNED
jgi:hypothetical protein